MNNYSIIHPQTEPPFNLIQYSIVKEVINISIYLPVIIQLPILDLNSKSNTAHR